MNTKLLLFFILYSSFSFSQSTIKEATHLYNNGSHYASIDYCLKTLKNTNSPHFYYQLIGDNYLKLGNFQKFIKYSQEAFEYIPKKKSLDSCLLYSNFGEYYHHILYPDSSVYFAEKSKKILEQHIDNASNYLKARVYMTYGNCMRNDSSTRNQVFAWRGGADTKKVLKTAPFIYLHKALEHASKHQIQDILIRLGNSYNDLVSVGKGELQYNTILDKCIETYKKALPLIQEKENSSPSLAKVYALLGLTYQYDEQHYKADSLYNIAFQFANNSNSDSLNLEYNLICSWRGWNYETWYKKTKNINLLKKATASYKLGVSSWINFYKLTYKENVGLEDGYRISTIQKLPNCYFYLFKNTLDSSYIDSALYYGDLDNYLSYHINKKNNIADIKTLQKLLEDETLVYYISSMNPKKTLAIIISKNTIDFIEINNKRIKIRQEDYNNIKQFNNIESFKDFSFGIYQKLFKPIDSLMTIRNQENLIIIPSSGYSILNFDLIISDTTNNKWENLPYMFHKYNISYALSPSIFIDNHKNKNAKNASLGILSGRFENNTNLIFSKRLNNWLEQKFEVNKLKDTKNLENSLNQNAIYIINGHGDGNLFKDVSNIDISDSTYIQSSELYQYKLNNELVITTACNSNQSRSFYSEGNTGGFTKPLFYAGVKSVISTDWEIDDKTNYLVMQLFFKNLSKGTKKSRSLWLAKKQYWNSTNNNIERSPFYWASYKFFGNTNAIKLIPNKNKLTNYIWLFSLTLLPLIIFFKKRFIK